MDIPAGFLDKFTTPALGAPRSEREEMLSKFLARLNQDRDGREPVTMGQLVKKLKGRKAPQLYELFRECEGAKKFGALFWHKIKNNKV